MAKMIEMRITHGKSEVQIEPALTVTENGLVTYANVGPLNFRNVASPEIT